MVKNRVVNIVNSGHGSGASPPSILKSLQGIGGNPATRERLNVEGGENLTRKTVANIRAKILVDEAKTNRRVDQHTKGDLIRQVQDVSAFFKEPAIQEQWVYHEVGFTDLSDMSYGPQKPQRSIVFARKSSVQLLAERGVFVMMDSTHCSNELGKY